MADKVALDLGHLRQAANMIAASVTRRSVLLRRNVSGVPTFDEQVAVFESAVAHHRNFVFDHSEEISRALVKVARDFEAIDRAQADAIRMKKQ